MVFFRVDSNNVIAGGHVMRCIAIARELLDRGEKVRFLVADDNPVSVLEESEIDYTVLNSDWRDLMSDVWRVKGILQKEEGPTLFVDTYSICKEYVDALKPYCRMVYLGSKQEYLGEVDLLINYAMNIDIDFYHQHYDHKTKFLLGPSFAPLRKEFRDSYKETDGRIRRILLTTGNTDKDHIANRLVESLLPIARKFNIVIDVVVGRLFDNQEELKKRFGNNKHVNLQENVRSMSSLMKNADVAISANGTTVYEMAAVGLPAITFAMVPEQSANAEAVSKMGMVDYIGKSYEDMSKCIRVIVNKLSYYIDHPDELVQLSKNAHCIVDGSGCKRIVDRLLASNEK